MKPILKSLVIAIIAFTSMLTHAQSSMKTIDKSTVKELDINKYLGTWYEIARYPHRFERKLQGVTATYSFRKDGKIKVVNQGYKNSLEGKRSKATGKAKLNENGIPSQLKVSFFGPFYGDYLVMELDPEYRWALVGSSSDDFLWVLSRTPKLDENIYNEILSKAVKRGYNLEKLQKVQH